MRLLIGPAGSGKTTRCLSDLRRMERAGRRALWIVPDQFTYAADRLLLDCDDLPGARFVRVVSFRRLAHLAADRIGLREPLTDEARRLLLRRLVQASSPEQLGPLAAVRQTPGFVEALARVFKELKTTAGSAAAERLGSAVAGEPKIVALCRLIEAYDDALERAGLLDPGDWVLRVADHLRAASHLSASRPLDSWRDHEILVDGFTSFTPEERSLLEALVRISPGMTVTLCADPDDAARALGLAHEAQTHGILSTHPQLFERLRAQVRRPCFLPSLRTLLWLARLPADRLETEYLRGEPHRFRAVPLLARLERGLFRDGAPDDEPPVAAASEASLRRERFPTAYHEVVGWARWIDARTRLAGGRLRYRDIAVLVRDLETYRPLVQEVFSRYRIPVFVDQRRDATAHPLLRLCLSALQVAARGWTRDAVVNLLRNPLLGLPPERVDRIENLSREYGIEYDRWFETRWEILALPARDTSLVEGTGEENGEQSDPACECVVDEEEPPVRAADPAVPAPPPSHPRPDRALAAGEAREAAQRLFPPLRDFEEVWRTAAPGFAQAAGGLRLLLSSWLPADWLTDPGSSAQTPSPDDRELRGRGLDLGRLDVSRFPAPVLAVWPEPESIRIAQILEDTLRLGAELTKDLPVSASLFIRLIKDAFRRTSIGVTPRSLDEVQVAEPRRSRVDEVRAVILGGLTAAAFPRTPAEDPLLSDREREHLSERGFALVPHAAVQAEEDPYLFYIACTRARETLWLTYPAITEDGTSVEPSCYLEEIQRLVPAPLSPGAPGGPAARLSDCHNSGELAGALTGSLRRLDDRGGAEVAATLRQAAPETEGIVDLALRRAERLRGSAPGRLPADLCEELYPGRTLHASPSRLESFGRCPFQHFARYLLRLEKRPEATLTPRSTGSAVHAALERFFSTPGLPRDESDAVARIGEIFQALAREEAYRIFQVDPPSAYRWQIAGRNLGLFVRAEFERLRQSRFQPAGLELGFGAGAPSETDVAAEAARASGGPAASERRRWREALAQGLRLSGPLLPPLVIAVSPEAQAQGRLLLHGRIDRLDIARDEGGALLGLVLDYKQRRAQRAPAGELARGIDLQIAIYLLVVEEILGIEPAGGLYYSTFPAPRIAGEPFQRENPQKLSMLGFYVPSMRAAFDPAGAFTGPKGGGTDDLKTVLHEVRERVRAHAGAILQGEIGPAPIAAGGRLPCEYCDFLGVCRFDEGLFRPAGNRAEGLR
ncbi:MAG: PD-(D/E)XK nuclease family protein [Candidatus Eisenbacteria bacterium]